jgi:hypothetical protein
MKCKKLHLVLFERKGRNPFFRQFVDSNGKKHQCMKFSKGKWRICRHFIFEEEKTKA